MDSETKVCDLSVQVPPWIDQDITLGTLTDIIEQGYAVLYGSALAIMTAYGDEVLQYLEDTLGERRPKWTSEHLYYI